MPINQDALNQLEIRPISDLTKEMCWGKMPFPTGFVPILAIINKVSKLPKGVLMRSRANSGFFLARNGALSTVHNKLALEYIKKADITDWENLKATWGGAREGAGRPKELPIDAVRRSIALTGEEFEFVKECVRLYRQEHNK